MLIFRVLLLTSLLFIPTALANENQEDPSEHTGDIEGLVIGDSGSILGGGDFDLDDLWQSMVPADFEIQRTLWYAVTPTAVPDSGNDDDSNLAIMIHRASNSEASLTTLTLYVSKNLTVRIQEHFVIDPATETRKRTARILVNDYYAYNPAVDSLEVFDQMSSLINRELEDYYGTGFINQIRAHVNYNVVTDAGLSGLSTDDALGFFFFAKFVESIKLFDGGATQQPLRVQYYVNRLASDLDNLTFY